MWHLKGAQEYCGNKIIPRQIWAPDRFPDTYEHQNIARGTYWHSNGAWEHIGTGKVPRNVWNGARERMGTRMMHGHIWAQKECLGTYEYRECAQAHIVSGRGSCALIGTKMVPANVWAPEWCPYTYVPRHHSGANLCLGTTLEPIFERAPFRCLHVPNHH